jgi:hypothetical protein
MNKELPAQANLLRNYAVGHRTSVPLPIYIKICYKDIDADNAA